MRLIKYAHACVRLESDSGVLVIDPGGFSEREALNGADAVLVTHEHMDHLDWSTPSPTSTRQRPGLRVFTHAEVAPKLDAIASAVTEVAPGDAFEAAGFRVRAFGGSTPRSTPTSRGWRTSATWSTSWSTTRATRSTCRRTPQWTLCWCRCPGRG